MTGPLHGFRVIDLTTPRGEMAGRLLADLGAEVIKVEPPGGCESRRLPPVVDGDPSDAVWAGAPIVAGFVQSEPVQGDPVSERTEVRKLEHH